MRGKTFIISCCLFAIIACGTAFAQQGTLRAPPYTGPMTPMAAQDNPAALPFYSNLVVSSCTSCNYDTQDGVFVLGPNNCFSPGSTQWLAYPFIASKSGNVRTVQLAITDYGVCVASSTKFTVAIYSDNGLCNGPGTQIGNSVIATAPAAPCSLTNANFGRAGVTLTAGTTYWVVATTSTSPSQMGTTAVWWGANPNIGTLNFNDGNGWLVFSAGVPGGFAVQ